MTEPVCVNCPYAHRDHTLTVSLDDNYIRRGPLHAELTPTEAVICHTLLRVRDGYCPMERLIQAIAGGYGETCSYNEITTFIYLIRRKLKAAGFPVRIRNTRYMGYRFEITED